MPDSRIPDDQDVDRLLRDAGARLRATAPGTVTPMPEPRDTRRRWLLPASIAAAVVALVAGAVVVSNGGTETVQEVPAATTGEPPTPTVPVTTDVPPATAPATDVPVTVPPESTPSSSELAVSDLYWDGDGSVCVTLQDVTGCFPGGTLTSPDGEWTDVSVVTDTGVRNYRLDVSEDGFSVDTRPDGPVCGTVTDPPSGVWLTHVSCGEGGAALWAVVPTEPAGELRHEAHDTTGETIPLDIVAETADWRMYRAVIERGVSLECTLVAQVHGDRWYESCDVPQSPAHPGGRLLFDAGTAWIVDPLLGSVDELGDAPVRTNGCDGAIRSLGADLRSSVTMFTVLACDGDAASGRFGSVFIQAGPPDGGLATWARAADGTWSLTDTGTGIEPDPSPLPIPPVDVVLLDAGAPAVGFEDVTEAVRDALAANPGATIADAIAASDDELTSVETIPTLDMVAIPSLTLVDVGYPDDSVGGARYAVWTTEPDDGGDPLLVAYRWALCTRGVAAGEDLCI